MLPRIAVVLFAAAFASLPGSALADDSALLAAGAPAQAKRRVAIVDLAAPPNLEGISYKLTHDTRSHAAADPQVELVAMSEVQAALGADGLKTLKACGVKTDCLLTSAAKLPADRLIVGTLNRDAKNYLVSLIHLDLQRRVALANVERTVLIASRRLNADYAAALPALLRGEAEAQGSISVEVNTTDVLVTFDGVVLGATPLIIQALPGKHLLGLSKRSYMPIERFVVVEAGKTVTVKERLLPKP